MHGTQQTRNVFGKEDFYIWIKGNNRSGNPKQPKRAGAMKIIILKQGEVCLKPGNFTKSYLSRFAQEKTHSRSSFSLLLDYRHVGV